jgi:superfamily I DNA/RNA helicase
LAPEPTDAAVARSFHGLLEVGEQSVEVVLGVLAITFTNKAAGEMRERVAELVGPVGRPMWVSTFHAACSRILRREATLLGSDANAEAGQKAFLHRARMNGLAREGTWTADAEKSAS